MGKKLKKRRNSLILFIGKTKGGGPCTPVAHWNHYPPQPLTNTTTNFTATNPNTNSNSSLFYPNISNFTLCQPQTTQPLTARTLAANLWAWQFHHPLSPPLQLAGDGSLRQDGADSLKLNKVIEHDAQGLLSLSPAICNSEEVASYHHAISPTYSAGLKVGRLGESGYGLKMSTEVVKVLNRILSLEEKNGSNVSLINTLRKELNHARVYIQELIQEQSADKKEIEDLMKQVAKDEKNKDRDKIKAVVQSVREELEVEKKLRRRSDSLHRKLGKELSELKSRLSKVIKDLERERQARVLLEDLCDEFARGVSQYEKELQALKHKPENDPVDRDNQLMLHIAEAWLDERIQIKLVEAQCDPTAKAMTVDKLRFEMETFLQNKRSSRSKHDIQHHGHKGQEEDVNLRRHSLESIHLNETASAPRDGGDDDSTAIDVQYSEFNKHNDSNRTSSYSKPSKEIRKSVLPKKKVGSREKRRSHNLGGLPVQLKKNMDGEEGNLTSENVEEKVNQSKYVSIEMKSDECEDLEGANEEKGRQHGTHGSDHTVENLDDLLLAKRGEILAEGNHREDHHSHFPWRGHSIMGTMDHFSGNLLCLSSPIKQWNQQHSSADEVGESSSKLPQGLKGNTLKAKLLKARLERQHALTKAVEGP